MTRELEKRDMEAYSTSDQKQRHTKRKISSNKRQGKKQKTEYAKSPKAGKRREWKNNIAESYGICTHPIGNIVHKSDTESEN